MSADPERGDSAAGARPAPAGAALAPDPEARYVYGRVDAAFAPTPDAEASPPWGVGVCGAAVRLMTSRGGVAALISAVAPGPVAQTRRNMLAHTAVLERAMARLTVLPVRFGTIAPNATTLAACLARNDAAFRQALAEIEGRVELGVKASWREGVVFAEIIAGDAELCRLRDRLRSRPAQETYYERVELGRRVEAALAQRRAAEAATIIAMLAPLAERSAELRALDDDMIVNHAFLVPRAREQAFDARMEHVAERCGARVALRYVGPVPPYNFVTLRADWLGEAG
jgi:hypothetical protein